MDFGRKNTFRTNFKFGASFNFNNKKASYLIKKWQKCSSKEFKDSIKEIEINREMKIQKEIEQFKEEK